MIAIADAGLPGLSALGADALKRIAGTDEASLVRLRYRAGKRAVLHLATGPSGTGQGSAWFFEGDKARRLAARTEAATYDEVSGALYEAFPNDHRLPQVRLFLKDYGARAPALIGGTPAGAPRVVRYRPGLSCTFRCERAGGGAVYVKILADADPQLLAPANRRIAEALAGGPLSVAPVVATDASLSAIAYGEARGAPLDILLARGGVEPVLQSLDALRRFQTLAPTPERHMTRKVILERSADCVDLVAATVPACLAAAARILARLAEGRPRLGSRPIHADVKLEHIFLDGGRTTLIDTESVSLGPPDYDLAQLYGRLWQAEAEGLVATATVEAATREIVLSAGPAFGWCLDAVALRLARFHAQRPCAEAASRIEAIFERLAGA
ncbi:hypothetical protein EF888_14460 [Silicimonas algicola]|uniref:Phosphotransferase family enzyme n=1 Tax=Silicimonas algicola TaxID=1826607 RepID=A0A316G2L9_9RHOB|nr:phosphotransferase [Silicimonas algicola]AZQ68233.1 hypothetical protein EF888_14460 [Silicimonas algicola]PWK54635.1 phosphotransferase family enzyme [Silicimonas algicola]